MGHEQSITLSDQDGWYNAYGTGPEIARPLPLKHEFEKQSYRDEANAVAAAILRSKFHGMRDQFMGRPIPGRSNIEDMIQQILGGH